MLTGRRTTCRHQDYFPSRAPAITLALTVSGGMLNVFLGVARNPLYLGVGFEQRLSFGKSISPAGLTHLARLMDSAKSKLSRRMASLRDGVIWAAKQSPTEPPP